MDKHLNNWLDKVEGRESNSSNKAIDKERKRQGYDKKKAMASKIYTGRKDEYSKTKQGNFMKVHPLDRK